MVIAETRDPDAVRVRGSDGQPSENAVTMSLGAAGDSSWLEPVGMSLRLSIGLSTRVSTGRSSCLTVSRGTGWARDKDGAEDCDGACCRGAGDAGACCVGACGAACDAAGCAGVETAWRANLPRAPKYQQWRLLFARSTR